ncbi:hypothetical protein PSEUBRA_004748 [Kalmanozyma brasiliensis GHG001]|uniref:uncharacterized protein n=1 Tax=Kalmanozyma brasiliensis (strain GHG001) TaxID=1365824 RepID=UPI0028680167|nr:uncharacterized protein PSEUBRA_004748 [Kalmanozyma brasiliensis GHG001]KAF6767418.1 hypothetical protein PSEUBRA_004748 [Kalmanozyma brasiliensis GHG001]
MVPQSAPSPPTPASFVASGSQQVQRDRAASVSSLAPPKTPTRARSGSDASSFTRSRPAHDQWATDEESIEHPLIRRSSPSVHDRAELRPPSNSALLSRADHDACISPGQDAGSRYGAPLEVLAASADADWDAELGLSDSDHAAPLRLPQSQPAPSVLPASRSTTTTNDSVNEFMCATSHLEKINAANLRGIRVTSTVSESWDEDFLFQNEDEAAAPHPHNDSTRSQSRGSSDHHYSAKGAKTTALQSLDEEEAESDNDVENWDDEFSWNADQMITPSASTSLPNPLLRTIPKAQSSDESSSSDVADLSARLTAQHDTNTSRTLFSRDRNDPDASNSSRHDALGLIRHHYNAPHSLNRRGNDSGGDTETETPPKESKQRAPIRPARRSLGAALGFGTRPKAAAAPSAPSAETWTQSPSRVKDKARASTEVKTHQSTQSKPKGSALQRLSFSRSRNSAGNASNVSIDETPEDGRSQQRPYNDRFNQSQASVLSHFSAYSNRSQRGDSSTSLERSYAALRSASFRRFFSRGDMSSRKDPETSVLLTSPPTSPLQNGLVLTQPILHVSSPARDETASLASDLSTSPPSAWFRHRRSIETTPTRPTDRSCRRGSGLLQGGPPEDAVAVPSSQHGPLLTSSRPPQNQTSSKPLTITAIGPSRVDDRNAPHPPRLCQPTNAGLRRDFSSSNTLRATSGIGPADSVTPTRAGRSAFAEDASAYGQDDGSDVHTHLRSDEAYAYGGERMHRGDRGSTSRSVSTSTAHSQASSESMYGYKMRKQVSVSSGQDALDSETSYGTSVGSSPGLANPSSWASFRKGVANASVDMKETDSILSADLSSSQEISFRRETTFGRTPSSAGSFFGLERTLDGASAVGVPLAARQQSVLQGPTSASQDTDSMRAPSARLASPLTSAHQALPGPTSDHPPSSRQTTLAAVPSDKRAPRRNSLGDLKIPSRISQAQTGIRNNINLVRDFAKGIEELKVLKASYMDQRATTPLLSSEAEERIRNWLECADVLIGLGEGRSEADSAARVETLSHTTLSTHADGRRTTFSDASAGPMPTMDHRPSLSSARNVSGTSQSTVSTTDGTRSVDVHREIDILSAILGGTTLHTNSAKPPRSHGRFQSETYARGYPALHSGAPIFSTPQTKVTASSTRVSNLVTPERTSFIGTRIVQTETPSMEERRNTGSPRTGVDASLTDISLPSEPDVGDINRSAKRRLRSASRAGLQGLKELIKGFRNNAGDDNGTTKVNAGTDDATDPSGLAIDGRPTTPSASKQKRKSLTLKRRSFLRSRTSLDSVHAKDADMLTSSDVAPPLPVSPESIRSAHPSPPKFEQREQRKPAPPLFRSSLETTRESSSVDEPAKRSTLSSSKSTRRVSLQPTRINSRTNHPSVDMVPSGPPRQPLSAHLRSSKPTIAQPPQQPHRPALAVRAPAPSPGVHTHSRRASTSVDTLHRHQPSLDHRPYSSATARSHSSSEGPPPLVQKLALRPEAMPGLLVYVQATRQHLLAAMEEMAPRQSDDTHSTRRLDQ